MYKYVSWPQPLLSSRRLFPGLAWSVVLDFRPFPSSPSPTSHLVVRLWSSSVRATACPNMRLMVWLVLMTACAKPFFKHSTSSTNNFWHVTFNGLQLLAAPFLRFCCSSLGHHGYPPLGGILENRRIKEVVTPAPGMTSIKFDNR